MRIVYLDDRDELMPSIPARRTATLLERCLNPVCRRTFNRREIGGRFPLPLRREPYHCPYCLHPHEAHSRGIFMTEKAAFCPDIRLSGNGES